MSLRRHDFYLFSADSDDDMKSVRSTSKVKSETPFVFIFLFFSFLFFVFVDIMFLDVLEVVLL